jgi:Zn-dependent protease
MPDATADLDKAAADIPLTRSARDILERAAANATLRGSPQADPEDVLVAIAKSPGSLAEKTMRSLNTDPLALSATSVTGEVSHLPLRQLLVNANREAQVLGHYQVDSIHLLLALLYSDSPVTAAALQKAGLTLYDVRRHLQMGALPGTPISSRPGRSQALDAGLRRKPWPRLRGVLGVSPVFLGLLAIAAASGVALWLNVLPDVPFVPTVVFVTTAFAVSVCVHEFGHALVAYLGGDRSVASSGYLDLNPLRYSHPIYSIALPLAFLLLGGIALPGGAVYIDRAALRSRTWDSAVSIAGPVGTLLCTLAVAAPFLVPGLLRALITSTNLGFFEALAVLGFFLAMSVILNLVPIPPLDGFGIIRPWLPFSMQVAAAQFAQFGMMLVFIALWTVAPVRQGFYDLVLQTTDHLGIPAFLISAGLPHMRPF